MINYSMTTIQALFLKITMALVNAAYLKLRYPIPLLEKLAASFRLADDFCLE